MFFLLGGLKVKNTRRSRVFNFCKIIFVVFMFILFSNLVVIAQDNDKLSVQYIKDLQSTDSGIDTLIKMFDNDEAYLKSSKPFYYHYMMAAKHLYSESDYKKADKQYRLAYDEAVKNGDLYEQALASNSIVNVNSSFGDTATLIEYGSKIMDIGKQLNDSDMISIGYYNIAWGHYFIYDDQVAKEYIEMCYEEAKKTNNQQMLAQYYLSRGSMSLSSEKLEDVRLYYNKANEILDKQDLSKRTYRDLNARAKGRLLVMDSKQGKSTDKTIAKMNDLILKVEKEHKYNTELLITLYEWKADILLNFGKLDGAIESYEKSLELGQKVESILNGYDPFEYSKLQLAGTFYRNKEFKKSADTYNALIESMNETRDYKKYEENIEKVKNLSEGQLNQKIEMLNALKKADDEKIYAQNNFIRASILTILLFIVGFILIAMEYKRILSLKKTIYNQSITDSLTQIYNRGKIIESMENDLTEDSVVALIDIDDFKQINDNYGHMVGDEILVGVVDVIKSSIRINDVLGRYGGEEFILILKKTDKAEAMKIIDRVRKNVEEIEWSYEQVHTTISIGMMKKCNLNVNSLFVEVDNLLYEAKRKGKNCIVYKECIN